MRILTALDRSEYAEIVLEHGLDHAGREPAAELHFVTVVAGDDGDHESTRQWLAAIVRDGLEAFDIPDREVVLHVRRGAPASVIGDLARELAPDLVVLGRFHVPSESDELVATLDCPVLVVGIDGPVLEPQCPACREVRRESEGERLFCDDHTSDRLPDLVTRLPPSTNLPSRLW